MKRQYWRLGMSLAGAMALGAAAHAQSGTQQQPDAAPAPAEKKVYTNDDLRAMRGNDVSVVGAKKQTAPATPKGKTQPQNEQYWRNRAQNLHRQMAEVDRQIAELESTNPRQGNATNSTNTAFAPTGGYYGNSRAGMQYQNQMKRLQTRKAQIQAQIDQLEEDARRANVPPGWLR